MTCGEKDFTVRIARLKHSFPHEPVLTAEDLYELECELLPQISDLAPEGSLTQRKLVNLSRNALKLYRALAELQRIQREEKTWRRSIK